MATLHEYYETDFSRTLSTQTVCNLSDGQGRLLLKTTGRVHWEGDSNALFVSYYLPASAVPLNQSCEALVKYAREFPTTFFSSVEVLSRLPGEPLFNMREGVFTGRVFIYYEGHLPETNQQALCAQAKQLGASLILRGLDYSDRRSEVEKPLAFICHDSRNKDAVAKPIALQMQRFLCRVWFDEFSLKIGDSLRENIERGIKESHKCILVVSPEFLANPGWTKTEFNAIFTKGLFENRDVLLPVWCGVTKEQVYEYSPTLADRKAVDWKSGCEEVCRQLIRAVRV